MPSTPVSRGAPPPDLSNSPMASTSRQLSPRRATSRSHLRAARSSPVRSQSSATPVLPSLFDRSSRGNTSVMERKLLTAVEEIKVKVNLNTKLLHAVLRKIDNISNASNNDETEMEEDTFPLKDRSEVENLEERINEELGRNLVKILSGIGGDNLKSTVRRLLAYMFTNTLAREINWKGKGGKIAFFSLKIKDLLIKAVRSNRLCSMATESEIANITKEWFRYVSDRDGGRKLREQRRKENQSAGRNERNEDPNTNNE